jgi:hypothetical protein
MDYQDECYYNHIKECPEGIRLMHGKKNDSNKQKKIPQHPLREDPF